MGLRILSSGNVAVLFDDGDGHVRHIRVDGVEILRGIYGAVRDRNWGTVAPRLSGLQIAESESEVAVAFEIETVASPVDFVWRGRIHIDSHRRRIDYTFKGKARTSFLKNRIGFCVLHPAGLGGTAVKITPVEGQEEGSVWPAEIAPHQPFLNLRQISHTPAAGLEVTVKMTGDTFETEDQRNWTDASFKTYCTPLGQPFPVEIKAGDEIHQAISVQWNGPASGAVTAGEPVEREPTLRRTKGATERPLPEIGFGASEPVNGEVRDVPWLAELRPAHLRVDLRDAETRWAPRLRAAWAEARAAGARLEVAIFGADADPTRDFAAVARTMKNAGLHGTVKRWLVYGVKAKTTPAGHIGIAREVLDALSPGAEFVAGTDAYFAEFNRQPPPLAGADAVAFSINPQVHAFDDLSLVETMAIQGDVVRNAARIAGGKPVVVSPVTLKPRFNPNATAVENSAAGVSELPDSVDPRQRTIMGALWTLGSIKHLAEAGATAVTYYRVSGWHGLGFAATAEPGPTAFPARPGELFPVWQVLRALADFKGGRVVPLSSSHPLQVSGMLLASGDRRRLLVAHFGDEVLPWRSGELVPTGVAGRVLAAETATSGEPVRESCPPLSVLQWDWNEPAPSPARSF